MTPEAHILVVDDQQDHLKAVQLILEGMSYHVIPCIHAAEALEILQAQPVDLILADIAMPHINGYQLFEEVRRHPEWATIPFIFLTARALDSDIRYGKAMGVDDYMTKPIQPEDLLATVEGKLRRHQELQQSIPAATATAPDTTAPLTVGVLQIDSAGHQIWFAGQPVKLSVREFSLLEYLARHVGQVVDTCDLLEVTHGVTTEDAQEARELLRPFVRSVRRKLGYGVGEPGCIETVRGLGYRLVEPTATA